MAGEVFRADRLSRSFFGVRVVHDVSLTLHAGKVLGVVGENGSGKSTTMNMIGGVLRPDAGTMQMGDEPYAPADAREAAHRGIAFIHQELNLFRNLSVAENLFITALPRYVAKLPFVDRGKVKSRAQELLRAVDLNIAPETVVSRLSQGERQLVEIAKALGSNARVIIFDEPTTSLTSRETDRLFAIIERLRSQDIAIIYISHVLSDIMRLSDDILVMRDGHAIANTPKADCTIPQIIAQMVGRSVDQLFPERPPERTIGKPILEVKGLSQPGIVRDINFTLHAGEVLGISGLMGAGRSELARILFGLDPHQRGEIVIGGEPLTALSPANCMARGMAFVTEDRRGEGLMMDAPITDNIALPSLPQFAAPLTRFVQRAELERNVRQTAADLQLKARTLDHTPVRDLSGGNQQKVVIGKWLLHKPRVFIIDEPTRGIDVGAKFEIYKIVNQLTASGAGVLFISSELEELIGMCDRILVMAQGEIRGSFERAGFDREALLTAAMWDSKELLA